MSQLDQIDLNSLHTFDAVAQAGSFTAAAERMGVAKARVSVQIARLERELGVALFTRTTRQVVLTDAGRNLHAQCEPLLRSLSDALDQAGSDQNELSGMLRISSTLQQATQSIIPALLAFCALHPRLQLDLRTSDYVADMVAEGIDLSFRMGWLRDSTQRAVRLGDFKQYVVASPAYLARQAAPRRPEDLAQHAWIAMSLMRTPLTWTFTDGAAHQVTVQMTARMQVDSPGALLAMAQGGAGVTVLEGMTVKTALQDGSLVTLLPEWTLPAGGVYAVLPPGRLVPARVRSFIDFYKDYLARSPVS